MTRLKVIRKQPVPRAVPDFTVPDDIHARRRIAMLLAAGLPLPTVAVLFGLREHELRFTSVDELAGDEESTS